MPATTRLTFGSLFAGIGGIDLGLTRAGLDCVWQVEIDAYCRKVLAKHWPHVRRHDDVKTFPPPEGDWSCDLLAGGFPCQDISNAGRRAGLDGSRSGLWSEFVRIIRLLRPRYVLVENVSALLVRGLDRVLGNLAESGYDAEWDCIPAAALGAPHLRWRVFLLAYTQCQQQQRRRNAGILVGEKGTGESQASQRERFRDSSGDCGSVIPDANSQRRQEQHLPAQLGWAGQLGRVPLSDTQEQCGELRSTPRGRAGRSASNGHADVSDPPSRFAGQRRREQFQAYCEGIRNLYWPQAESPVCGMVDGISHRVDRLGGLGNAVVPPIAEWIGQRILAFEQENLLCQQQPD